MKEKGFGGGAEKRESLGILAANTSKTAVDRRFAGEVE